MSLERLPGLRGQLQVQHRIVPVEDPGQHLLGASSGELPRVQSLVAGELPAIVQRDVGTGLGFDEEPVLGEKTGEEHPVPVLVGDFVGESRDLLGAGFPVVAVAELAGAAAEAVTEGPLGLCRGVEGAAKVDREGFQRLAGARFGGAAGLLDGAGEPGAEVGGEGGHGNENRHPVVSSQQWWDGKFAVHILPHADFRTYDLVRVRPRRAR